MDENILQIPLGALADDETEIMPIINHQDEEDWDAKQVPDVLPILPLRNTVLFPGVVIPITVGRDKSIKLIKDAYRGKRIIGVVSQKETTTEDPVFADLNTVGTIATILKTLHMPDGNTTVIIQGRMRMSLQEQVTDEPYITARIKLIHDSKPEKSDKEFSATIDAIKDVALQIIKLNPQIPAEAGFAIKNIESDAFLVHFISSNMNIEMLKKQEILEVIDLKKRSIKVLEHLNHELQLLELKNQINSKVKVDIDKQQREYYLHQQLRQIQEELGGSNPDKEIAEIRERGKAKKWNEATAAHFNKEVERLSRLNPASAEYSVSMNYLDTLLQIPFGEYTNDNFDLKNAQQILEKDHFGLEKIKARILEYLAVLKLKGDMKSPIICLYGPPGVGKTSLGKSIASSLGRNYVRVSLGGVHDEAEIRGHRKTYIGAMPGRIIQSLKKAKSCNPVFVLDEIDKLANSLHGDPSSALLEALDPEQNTTFYDNYLEVDFDLSKVLFIATANNLSTIQPALLDRMEVIEISGYTIEEKVQIASKYLIPKQLEAHGLKKKQLSISEKIIEKIIDEYTSESGVRNLEKQIASVTRGIAKMVAMEESYAPTINAEQVETILGTPRYMRDKQLNNDVAGVVTGLAWTQVGGSVLFIESSLSKGNGKLTLTGNLGDVMKESTTIALAYIKANAARFNLKPEVFEKWDIHVHVPEGATPKDGPSAGITMLTSLVSLLTQRKVKNKIAMTGEITLRGKVLPVGGIKEKILAAKRIGIKEIILCAENKKDIDEIKPVYIKDLTFHYVKNMMEVLDIALLNEKVKNAVPVSA